MEDSSSKNPQKAEEISKVPDVAPKAPAASFEVEEPVAKIRDKLNIFSRYIRFLKNYKYNIGSRIMLTLWYVYFIYTIIIVLDFPVTRLANYYFRNEHMAKSWASSAEIAIKSLELIAPGSTQNLSHTLLYDLPDKEETYYIYHFGLCRESKFFDTVCYRGEGDFKLIARDLAVQVAESKGIVEIEAFISQWDLAFQAALEEGRRKIKEHTHCKRGPFWSFYHKRCTIDLDKTAVNNFELYVKRSKRPSETKLWMAMITFFFITALLDAVTYFVFASSTKLAEVWGVSFGCCGLTLFLYLLWKMFKDIRYVDNTLWSCSGSAWLTFVLFVLHSVVGVVCLCTYDNSRR